jgi:hypothetical protein
MYAEYVELACLGNVDTTLSNVFVDAQFPTVALANVPSSKLSQTYVLLLVPNPVPVTVSTPEDTVALEIVGCPKVTAGIKSSRMINKAMTEYQANTLILVR